MTDELSILLERIGTSGFTLHGFQYPQGPLVLAAVRDYGGVADVLIVWDQDTATAYRAPSGPAFDVFQPANVYWHYAVAPVWVLRALLTLAPPGHPDAPALLKPVPTGYGLPAQGRTPVPVETAQQWRSLT
jgi:hypothetical protein